MGSGGGRPLPQEEERRRALESGLARCLLGLPSPSFAPGTWVAFRPAGLPHPHSSWEEGNRGGGGSQVIFGGAEGSLPAKPRAKASLHGFPRTHTGPGRRETSFLTGEGRGLSVLQTPPPPPPWTRPHPPHAQNHPRRRAGKGSILEAVACVYLGET